MALLKTTSIRFTREQRRHLRRLAKEQRHGKMAQAVKRLVEADMLRLTTQQ